MSNGQAYFVQFTTEEFLSFTQVDREVIHNVKRCPRCNDAKHHECTIEVDEEIITPEGVKTKVKKSYHWMHGDGQVGVKKWSWCKCLCHIPIGKKAQWMKDNLPSYKA